MPMIVNDRKGRLAFLFGRQSGIRGTGETLEQVQELLRRKKAQRAFARRDRFRLTGCPSRSRASPAIAR
jgi:hypothetical protein